MAVQPYHYFLIKSRMNGLCMDIDGSRHDPKTRVLLWTQHGNDNQQFYFDPQTGTIRSKMHHFCIDIEGENNTLVANPFQPGDPNQQWEMSGQQIRNRMYPNRVLDVMGRNMSPGALIGAYDFNGGDNQSWEFLPSQGAANPQDLHQQQPQMGASTAYPGPGQPYPGQPYPGQPYPGQPYPGQQTYPGQPQPPPTQPVAQPRREFQILSEMNNKAVDIPRANAAPDTKICMYKSNGQKNQLWYTDPQGFIRSSLNDMVFFGEDGHSLKMGHYTGDPRQQWKFEGNKIMNGQGNCLDIRGESHSDGAELCAYKFKDASNQKWKQHFVN